MLGDDTQSTALVNLFRKGTKLTYKKGEFIIRPNEAPSGVFYIEEGLVKAFDITKYGEENLLVIRKKKELFPLISSVTGEGRNIIYQALSPVTVMRISQDHFRKKMKNSSELILVMLDLVVEMYQLHSERILNLEYRTVRERLISFLIILSRRFGHKTSHGTLIAVPLKNQDIASSINASRETTNRELSKLEQKGLIAYDQSRIVLVDVKTLKTFL